MQYGQWTLGILGMGAVWLLAGCPRGEESAAPFDAGTGEGDPPADLSAAGDAGLTTTSLVVQNPGFETTFLNPGSYVTNTPPPGWQSYGSIDYSYRSIGSLNPSTTALYVDPAPEGRNVGVVFLLDRPGDASYFASSEAGLQQTLTATLLPSTQYTLVVEVGNIATDGSPSHPFNFAGFPNYRIDLLAGGQILASDNNTLRPNEGRFLTSTVSFTSGSQHPQMGMALSIRLVNLNNAVGTEVNFDNVRLRQTR
ncbi:MAG TPA: hypothetical protein PKI03_34225 [Pseudomonadota bacterium]|nr:hypothetical protein [Pseudomonadota bacterium]